MIMEGCVKPVTRTQEDRSGGAEEMFGESGEDSENFHRLYSDLPDDFDPGLEELEISSYEQSVPLKHFTTESLGH